MKQTKPRSFRDFCWHGLALVICLGLAIFAYHQLLQGYFATDEWWAFSYAIANPEFKDLLKPAGVYAPSANIFIHYLYTWFGVQALPWAWLTLILHLINTIIVYCLTLRLSHRWSVAAATAALFAVVPMGSQFLDQFSMMPTSGMATLFGLLGLLVYSYHRSIIAAFLFFIALSFSPYATPFILLAAVIEIAAFSRRTWWKSLVRYLPVGAAFGLYYLIIREMSLKSGQLHDRPVAIHQSLVQQLMVYGQKMYQGYGELVMQLPGTIDPKLMLKVSTIIAVLTVVGLLLLWWRRQFRLGRTMVIGFLWVPASLSIFSTLNTVSIDATFPSRYFYVTTIGFALLLVSFLAGLFGRSEKKETKDKEEKAVEKVESPPKLTIDYGDVAVVIIALLLVGYYLPKTRDIVAGEVTLGKTRKMILDTILSEVPSLRRDGIFCFTSNTGHYAVAPEVIPLPFAHNFAFNLAIHYRAEAKPLRPFFTESGYFVNPAASFYYYSGDQHDPNGIGPGIGMGPSMAACKALKERFNFVSIDDFYGFAYDGNKPALTNITEATRQYLRGEAVPDSSLYPWR